MEKMQHTLLSQYSTGKWDRVGHEQQEIYMAYANPTPGVPNANYILLVMQYYLLI